MSSTRYNTTGEFKPEALLASSRLRGISIGGNIICRVARVLPEIERRAMLWLCNYSAILDITADSLSDQLDLDKSEIRAALTDPEFDRTRFIRQVGGLRANFEAGLKLAGGGPHNPFTPGTTFHDAYGSLANTAVRRKVSNAAKFAGESAQIIEVIGKTRTGKSVAAAHQFFHELDHALWLHCPRPGTEKDFFSAIAKSAGMNAGTALKCWQIVPKIEAVFGPALYRKIYVDEAHRLWPSDLRHEPKRIEFLRDLWEKQGVSSMLLATPQYSESMARAMEDNPRWSPGQWDGRVQRYHLADTMTPADLRAVAAHHMPEASEAILDQLVEQAISSEGFCGAMVKAIQRARFIARETERPINIDTIRTAQAELAKGTRIAAIAAGSRSKRRAA